MTGQGPFATMPSVEVPAVAGFLDNSRRWAQVSTGEWYAFFNKVVGPDTRSQDWCGEHPDDPNWWCQPGRSEDRWVCRHGHEAGACPDGSCGPTPTKVSAHQVSTAVRGLRNILGANGNESADEGLQLCEDDLRLVMALIDQLNVATKKVENIFVHSATMIVKGASDTQIGTLRYGGDNAPKWYFTAHEPPSP